MRTARAGCLIAVALTGGCSRSTVQDAHMPEERSHVTDVAEFYDAVAGEWEGNYDLWLDPSSPKESSRSSAQITKVATGDGWEMTYQWARGEATHRGVFQFAGSGTHADFSWTDSFHSASDAMTGDGGLSDDGSRLVFMSHYPAGGGADWGWRTEFILVDPTTLSMDAYNITPDGQEVLAVRAVYVRN